jgi:signal transduction histidine kinase
LEDERTRKSKGTGLGLYLSTKIINDHGGAIEVRDNLPKGSIFVIQLPKPIINGR